MKCLVFIFCYGNRAHFIKIGENLLKWPFVLISVMRSDCSGRIMNQEKQGINQGKIRENDVAGTLYHVKVFASLKVANFFKLICIDVSYFFQNLDYFSCSLSFSCEPNEVSVIFHYLHRKRLLANVKFSLLSDTCTLRMHLKNKHGLCLSKKL